MNGGRFDGLARRAGSRSRRTFLQVFAAALVGAAATTNDETGDALAGGRCVQSVGRKCGRGKKCCKGLRCVNKACACVKTACLTLETGYRGPDNTLLNRAADLVVDGSGVIYVVDEGDHAVVKYARDGSFVARFGGLGAGDGEFRDPHGIAWLGGDLAIADNENQRVQVLTTDGSFVRSFAADYPHDIILSGDSQSGTVYVRSYAYISAFDPDGSNERLVASLYDFFGGNSGGGEGLGLDGDRNLLVPVDDGFVAVISPDGNLVRTIGRLGTTDGRLQYPADAQLGPGGNIYVADEGNGRVEVFSPTGDYVAQWNNGDRWSPQHLAVSGNGDIYTSSHSSVQRWTLGA